MSDRVIVVLPTYNEVDNLAGIVARIRTSVPSADILVVDDDSPDGTGRLAADLSTRDSNVHVLHRIEKAGLGAAYLAGFAWALERQYDVIVESDADGSHRPEHLPSLLAALHDNGLVIGSRWVEGGGVVDWPLHRLLLSRAGSLYAGWMLGLRQKDITGGYRAYSASLLRQIDLSTITSQGYCFQIELLWRASAAGAPITEVPITFAERTRGESKMSLRIVVEAMGLVTVWGVRRLFGVPAPENRAMRVG